MSLGLAYSSGKEMCSGTGKAKGVGGDVGGESGVLEITHLVNDT